jgi:hypothetical protein
MDSEEFARELEEQWQLLPSILAEYGEEARRYFANRIFLESLGGSTELAASLQEHRKKALREFSAPSASYNRDAAARKAVELISYILKDEAGWALNHIAGRIILGHPEVYEGSEDDEEAEAVERQRLINNSVELELAGGLTDWSDHKIVRRFCVALLDMFASVWTHNALGEVSPFRQLSDALRALEFGIVSPLLHKERRKHGDAIMLWRLRSEALEFVSFRMGLGATREDAIEQVANALKVDTETISTWERRAPNGSDDPDEPLKRQFAMTRLFARRSGEKYRAWLDEGSPMDHRGLRPRQSGGIDYYSEERLSELAAEYGSGKTR